MRKLLLLTAVMLTFSFMTMAQVASTTGSQDTSSTKTTETTKTTKTTKAEKKGAKEHTLTGCLEKSASGTGYTLVNKHHKNGIEVTTSEDWSSQVGHKVKLTGNMEKGAQPAFAATNLKSVSDTCAPAGKAAAKNSKKSKSSGTASEPAPKS